MIRGTVTHRLPVDKWLLYFRPVSWCVCYIEQELGKLVSNPLLKNWRGLLDWMMKKEENIAGPPEAALKSPCCLALLSSMKPISVSQVHYTEMHDRKTQVSLVLWDLQVSFPSSIWAS